MASRPLALVSEQLDGATQRDEALGALVDPRQMPLQKSIGSINTLSPKSIDHPQVIKQSPTCASTRCWPELRP